MWTNVFRIGGLQQISWFQFLPCESNLSSVPEKSANFEEGDPTTLLILKSHLQLQNEGYLSTWTNSFVGPWDPSQGDHNPDEKIKLWLFLPGRHLAVIESAQPAVSKLKVVGSGLWNAPGDSEEIAVSLSQALRNRVERAFRGLFYVRYGDVFSRSQPLAQNDKNTRKLQPSFELVFTANEEAIYVHVIIFAKHVRTLSYDDMKRLLRCHSSDTIGDQLSVVVPPHGMQGTLTGCYPSEVVKQIFFSNAKVPDGFSYIGMSFLTTPSSGCQLRSKNSYVEVAFGSKGKQSDACFNMKMSSHYHRDAPSASLATGIQKLGQTDRSFLEKTLIYPAESVLFPVMHTGFSQSCLKRFWLQNFAETSSFDVLSLLGLSNSCFRIHNPLVVEHLGGSYTDPNGMHMQPSWNSISNGNSSSISSISSTSSESNDYVMGIEDAELEADADSFSRRESGLLSSDHFDNESGTMVPKRPRTRIMESFGQTGTGVSVAIQGTYSVADATNSASVGVASDHVGFHWDWDEGKGMTMDIQILLSEFGDFGDFFEDDDMLRLGEPPGTAESQSCTFSVADCGNTSCSPSTGGMDTDQIPMPDSIHPSFEPINQPPLFVDETPSHSQDHKKDTRSMNIRTSSTPSTGEFYHLSKSEAMLTFAPEYTAVEPPKNEFSASVFKSPYVPRYQKLESSNSCSNSYVYGSTPPSPSQKVWNDQLYIPTNLKSNSNSKSGKNNSKNCSSNTSSFIQTKKSYTHILGREKGKDGVLGTTDSVTSSKAVTPSVSGFNLIHTDPSDQRKKDESCVEPFDLPSVSTIAAEVECIMVQVAMCRIRHMLVSNSNLVASVIRGVNEQMDLESVLNDSGPLLEKTSIEHEIKKKDCPVRIAGEADIVMVGGPFTTTTVGVWRSVGVSTGTKTANNTTTGNIQSSPNNFSEGSMDLGQRQPLYDLLDALPLLIQQCTSLVDIALDQKEAAYNWLSLEEQRRRGFCCGPSMVHAGCGGFLSACHFLDIAGVELLDPVSSEVHAAPMISLLQSDIKIGLKSAFEKIDGPLPITEWCKSCNQLGESRVSDDGSVECNVNDLKGSSSVPTCFGDPISPSQSSTASSLSVKGSHQDINNPECDSQVSSCLKSSPFAIPVPSILVGYQEDWLKTSCKAIQVWEKVSLEPYAPPKPVNYIVVCPDIDPLTSAAADFFQQLGTVYETCRLGIHTPQTIGNQVESTTRKYSALGFALVDCPQPVKVENAGIPTTSMTKGWNVNSFQKNLSNTLQNLKLSSNSVTGTKEIGVLPCLVIYIVCPFHDPAAVLQTVVEASTSLGATFFSSDRERRILLYSQVMKALNYSASVDEASMSNILSLPGFMIPKLVVQIVTVETILRTSIPTLSELMVMKEIAFTVYNKVRRVPRACYNEPCQSSVVANRAQPSFIHGTSPIPALWKDCSGGARIDNWDSSWQASRSGALSFDSNRSGNAVPHDDARCFLFEPLFILAEPGSVEHAVSVSACTNSIPEGSTSRGIIDDTSGNYNSGGILDTAPSSHLDGTEIDNFQSSSQKNISLHCCYGWTEDWRWLVCIWTDSRGELLDNHLYPFGGISSRQDTKGLQCLFVQILQQGVHILSSCPDSNASRPRDIVVSRIGCFYELECQEWQKAIYLVGGNEVKKWTPQLRRSAADKVGSSSNGTSFQHQDLNLIQDRTLPSSPSPSLYSPQTKQSSSMKGTLVQSNARKQLLGTQPIVDGSKGMFQWVKSISLVGVLVDHSLNLIYPVEPTTLGGTTQTYTNATSFTYLEGFTPVKSLGLTPVSYLVIPSPSMCFLPPTPLQLPTGLTSESPPLAHLLHSKGSAIPQLTGFVVSKSVPSIRADPSSMKEEWPSTVSISLFDYYGGNNVMFRKQGKTESTQNEPQLILESVAAELHALSWMTVSPAYLDRRTALPFHCDMVLRLRRLLHYADKLLHDKNKSEN